LQPDSLIPDRVNPQAWNRYSYVGNRPVNFSDPSGHKAWDGDNGNYTKADAEYNRQRIDALKCRAGNKTYCSSGEKHPVETVVTVVAGLVTAGALPEIGVAGDALYTAAGTACLRTPICIALTGMAGGAGTSQVVHGNSLDSPRKTYLYQLVDKAGQHLKYGITSEEDPMDRYSQAFMRDKTMYILDQGTRRAMYLLENELILSNPRGELQWNNH
jgi:hypothetical protein